MERLYRDLLTPFTPFVSEKKHAYTTVTERHIQALWFEQKHFTVLPTACGQKIEIVSPGIWNAEAGPDFRKAHLRIGDKEYYGDIEIHLSDEGWKQHRHHIDPRYDHVILHVSLWNPRAPSSIRTSQNVGIFQTYLEDALSIAIEKIPQLIDLELYPYKKFIGSGHCAQELFQNLSPKEIRIFFEKAADWRLQQKRNFLIARVPDASLHLTSGIAMALGYKNNSEQFFSLFLDMKKETFLSEKHLLAWLLTQCGFFSAPFQDKWATSAYYQELKALMPFTISSKSLFKLHLHQIRPLNHPVRRLVLLVKMHYDSRLEHLFSQILSTWQIQWQLCQASQKWRPLFNHFNDLLPCYEDAYWNSHYLFEEEESSLNLTLLGSDLKREIIVNVVLPILNQHLIQKGDPEELEAFQQFYRSIASSKANKRHYLNHRFFGDRLMGDILEDAYTEQGAYQLHYDFCSHFEASCEGCPFVKRYKSFSL